MPRQIKKEKATVKRESKEVEQPVQEAPQSEKSEEEKRAETEALLDEIDDVLEVNAEEFVKNYVQKGGE